MDNGMKAASKAQVEMRNRELESQNGLLIQAVNAIANGEKVWIGKRNHYSVSVLQPDSAAGGIALVTFAPPGQQPYSGCYLLDEWLTWCNDQATYAPNNETLALRDLAYAAKRVQNEAQKTAA